MRPAVVPLGPLRVHIEVGLVGLAIGAIAGPPSGLAFVLALALHECGHALLAPLSGLSLSALRVRLQLGNGAAYLPRDCGRLAEVAVLVGGAAAGYGLIWIVSDQLMAQPRQSFAAATGYGLHYMGTVWTLYQLSPAPTADTGALLRRWYAGRVGRRRLGWILWAASATLALILIALRPAAFEPVVWLAGLVFILGRGEAAHLAAAEVYDAYDRGRHQQAVQLALDALPKLPRSERTRVAEIGLHAALEQRDRKGVAKLVSETPSGALLHLEAVSWLLTRDVDAGGLEAERLHDGVDSDRIAVADEEAYGELCFRHAAFEAQRLRPASALGMLERALEYGFDGGARLEAEGAFERLREHPRFMRVLRQLPPV